MKPLFRSLGLAAGFGGLLLGLSSCTKPLVIEVDQSPAQLAIATSVLSEQALLLSATYSINSLANLNDGGDAQNPLGYVNGILVGNATALLRSAGRVDTLQALYPGIYGSYSLALTPYKLYELTVRDNSNGTTVRATATYLPMVAVDTIRPSLTRTATDTTIQLHLTLRDDPARPDYFLLSYSSIKPSSAASAFGSANFSVLSASAEKKLEVFTDADAVGGRITRTFSMNARPSDTLYVHMGRIEKGYFEYLTAYKRTGSILTQLINEPITLPTNVVPGLGYFSLYEPKRDVFYLKTL